MDLIYFIIDFILHIASGGAGRGVRRLGTRFVLILFVKTGPVVASDLLLFVAGALASETKRSQ